MATLSDGGRISEAVVNDEIERLVASWRPSQRGGLDGVLSAVQIEALDLFDRLQLEAATILHENIVLESKRVCSFHDCAEHLLYPVGSFNGHDGPGPPFGDSLQTCLEAPSMFGHLKEPKPSAMNSARIC